MISNSRKDGVDNTPSGSKKEDNSRQRRHGKVGASSGAILGVSKVLIS